MKATTYGTALCCFWLIACTNHVRAADPATLPEWKAAPQTVAQLGAKFEDAHVSIQPPADLKRVEQPVPPELAERGIHSYAWTASGMVGVASPKNLSVTLTPYATPSSDALDKTIEGMQGSIKKGTEDANFGQVRSGRVNGFEARAGSFTAKIQGEKVIAYYLISIDPVGTYAVTAMLPEAEATPEAKRAFQTSLLTFRRPMPASQ